MCVHCVVYLDPLSKSQNKRWIKRECDDELANLFMAAFAAIEIAQSQRPSKKSILNSFRTKFAYVFLNRESQTHTHARTQTRYECKYIRYRIVVLACRISEWESQANDSIYTELESCTKTTCTLTLIHTEMKRSEFDFRYSYQNVFLCAFVLLVYAARRWSSTWNYNRMMLNKKNKKKKMKHWNDANGRIYCIM